MGSCCSTEDDKNNTMNIDKKGAKAPEKSGKGAAMVEAPPAETRFEGNPSSEEQIVDYANDKVRQS